MSTRKLSPHDNEETSKFRPPTELFGRSSEVDLALERKLLSNLKKHSPKILQPINPTAPVPSNEAPHTPADHIPHNTLPNKFQQQQNTNTAATSDGSLLTALTQRLTKLEEQSKAQQKEIASKDIMLQQLLHRVEEYRQLNNQLQKETQQSEKKISEMETFLSDYGLVWIGSDGSGNASNASGELTRDRISPNRVAGDLHHNHTHHHHHHHHENAVQHTGHHDNRRSIGNNESLVKHETHIKLPQLRGVENSKASPRRSESPRITEDTTSLSNSNFHIDVEKIRSSIDELNMLAGEGSAFLDHSGKGKKIRQFGEQQVVPLTLYKNGFKLFSGPFRPYSAHDSMPFINDLYDGYFPYELKDRYPNGVLFRLTDATTKEYNTKSNDHGNSKIKDTNIRGMGSIAENTPQSTSQFLHKLPVSTIKNGRIVDVRQSITTLTKQGATLTSPRSQQSPRGVTSNTQRVVNHSQGHSNGVSTFGGTKHVGTSDITHLKVKMETGETVIVRLHYDDTIESLRETIDKYRKRGGNYQIRTAFPKKLYNELSVTLREAGLIPNALVYIRDLNNV